MKSLPGYFKHINKKTYLDRYPDNIVKISNHKGKTLVEIGGGIGNDMLYLLKRGLNPRDLYFIENDVSAYNEAVKKLKRQFGFYSDHILYKDAKNTGLKDNIADFVYANNMLHCLKEKEEILAVLREVFRMLQSGGVFFGRTLLNKIDQRRLKNISIPRNNEEKFVLQTSKALNKDVLLGLSRAEFKMLALNTGFSEVYTEIKKTLKKWKPIKDFYFRVKK